MSDLHFTTDQLQSDPASDDLGDLASEFARLDWIKRELKNSLDTVKSELQELDEKILDQMERTGISSLNVDGLSIYAHNQLWITRPDGVDIEDACDRLEAVGLDDYSRKRYHSGQLSSFFRDLYAEEVQAFHDGHRDSLPDPSEVIPEELRDVLDLTEKTQVRTRKS